VKLAMAGGSETDEEELGRLTGQLRRRLLDLDVESVELVRGGHAPAGARAVDPAAIGSLLISLSPQVLPMVLELVTSWVKSRPVNEVEVTMGRDTIRIRNPSTEDEHALLEAFLRRHAARGLQVARGQ
jgi:hypothetical protein